MATGNNYGEGKGHIAPTEKFKQHEAQAVEGTVMGSLPSIVSKICNLWITTRAEICKSEANVLLTV
jgi:hypothetical protein